MDFNYRQDDHNVRDRIVLDALSAIDHILQS